MLRNDDIKSKLEMATEHIGILSLENDALKTVNSKVEELISILSLENDVLKTDNSKKEELLKAEIFNLNRGISRKTEKCADLSAEIDRLKKESKISAKENENLRIEIDKLKRDAYLQNARSEYSINKLQNDMHELRMDLKEAHDFKMRAQGQICQLNEQFGINNNHFSEKRVKELEDLNTALNFDLESLSNKFEQVTSCSLCEEKYESIGKRAPVKLKCSHVFCSHCAYSWLESKKKKPSCPSCREPYRSEDIRFVNLNTEF